LGPNCGIGAGAADATDVVIAAVTKRVQRSERHITIFPNLL